MTTPTRIDGVSSGGVNPAAGVICADATRAMQTSVTARATTLVRLIRSRYPDSRERSLRRGYIRVNSVLLHHPHEEKHEFQHQDQHDRELHHLPARNRRQLHRVAVDVVQRLELLLHVGLPPLEPETVAAEREQPRRIDVADELETVLGAIGQLVDVDEERVHLARGAAVAR